MNSKVLVAMSGGVDSSVAAALMKEQGARCIGVTMKLYAPGPDSAAAKKGCCSLSDVRDAQQAAHALAMPHYTLNFLEAFDEKVIRRFIRIYEAGGTPNPCIDCNRFIKFDRLLFKARQLDFELLATGHYARTEQEASGRWLLKKARDAKKDQSYVLYCLTQDQLSHTRFPLGELTKDEVREIARKYGFTNAAKQDSQDICFVPDRDYGSFMERYTGKNYPEGNILDTRGKIIGRHRGIVRYTLGQRRGIGVAANVPVYVIMKNMADNTITLGDESGLYAGTCVIRDINLIARDTLEKPLRCTVKTRYLQQEKPAVAEQIGQDEIRVSFDEPQRAVTPGQSAVLYDGDIVIGGGIIASAK